MKTTDNFKKIIKEYLDKRASSDELFAIKYANKIKNIDDCITYILNTVKQSGVNGFADEEIFSMAVHYYDEENIDVGDKITARVVVNHSIELTNEEKEKAREDAIKKYHDDIYNGLKKPTKKAKTENEVAQQSLFDV